MNVVNAILDIALAAAPWLLVGLFAAGLIRAFVPERVLQRWVGGRGLWGVSRAAVVGAPLPLCSCGAIPTALALHRGGAGRGPTTAFLIGTPGIGADSVAITYALLGPFMMLARAVGAVATAIVTGMLVAMTGGGRNPVRAEKPGCESGCCSGDGCSATEAAAVGSTSGGFTKLFAAGMGYAFGEILDDIGPWLLVGLVLAGVLVALVPPETLASVGSGLLPMLLMAVIGIPLYICATAATPVAAGMLVAGVSPGTVLVFLLAGPITSLATLGVLRREMGTRALACYLVGIAVVTVTTGLLADQLVAHTGLDVIGQLGAVRELVPLWLKTAALVVLVALAVRPVRRAVERLLPV